MRFLGNSSNENGLSIIDLGKCETILKTFYKIDLNIPLIIKKYEQIAISSERNVQYEVYHPLTKERLNLSLCDSDTIDLYIPIKLNEKLIELYNDLQNSGYDYLILKTLFILIYALLINHKIVLMFYYPIEKMIIIIIIILHVNQIVNILLLILNINF